MELFFTPCGEHLQLLCGHPPLSGSSWSSRGFLQRQKQHLQDQYQECLYGLGDDPVWPGPAGTWISRSSVPIRPRPKGGLSGSMKLCKTVWSKNCAYEISPPSKQANAFVPDYIRISIAASPSSPVPSMMLIAQPLFSAARTRSDLLSPGDPHPFQEPDPPIQKGHLPNPNHPSYLCPAQGSGHSSAKTLRVRLPSSTRANPSTTPSSTSNRAKPKSSSQKTLTAHLQKPHKPAPDHPWRRYGQKLNPKPLQAP